MELIYEGDGDIIDPFGQSKELLLHIKINLLFVYMIFAGAFRSKSNGSFGFRRSSYKSCLG